VRHNPAVQPADAGEGFVITAVHLEGSTVCLEGVGEGDEATCPSCGAAGWEVHDRYRRRPRDLSWRRWEVRLVLTVRRFRCPNPRCTRKTFAESFGDAVPRYARRTQEATTLLTHVAHTAGGEAGARLAAKARVPASPDTLLRLLRLRGRAHALDLPTSLRILGVDDLALRRGHRYATLLVDLDTHQPLDIVEDRTAEVLATWLRAHPGVEVVVRDRSEAYAEGARAGAPDALQVADRFHLVQNAGAALDELLRGRSRRLQIQASRPPPEPVEQGPIPAVAPRPPSRDEQRRTVARAQRVARWEEAHARHAAGETKTAIARAVGLDRKTIARWLRVPCVPGASGDPPPPKGPVPRPPDLPSPSLQPYLAYLQDRWRAGCTNISQLHREIAALGYARSRSLVAQALLLWRGPRPPPAPRRPDGSWRRGRPPRPRVRRFRVRWLCLRPPAQLDPDERAALDRVLAEHPDLAAGHALLQRFRHLVRTRDIVALNAWLADAAASGLGPFVSLATGIAADRAAVDAALALPWSNGPVEGHVHRVKLLKRQHYGRAKLDLLRARILAA
jgi:transposase